MVITIVLLTLSIILSIHATLKLKWIKDSRSSKKRVRILGATCIVIFLFGSFGYWIWPETPPVANQPEKKESTNLIVKPSEGKDTSVLMLVRRYPDINKVIQGEKRCSDLAPEAQIECLRSEERLRYVAMAMKDQRFTREDVMKLMQQSTLPEIKKVFADVISLKDSIEISKIYMPKEINVVYVFYQRPETLENGSSEFVGRFTSDEFLKNRSQFVSVAKNKHVKLIIRTSATDNKGWLQNQIKVNDKFLKMSKFLDPSTNKISEGAEWPLGEFQDSSPQEVKKILPPSNSTGRVTISASRNPIRICKHQSSEDFPKQGTIGLKIAVLNTRIENNKQVVDGTLSTIEAGHEYNIEKFTSIEVGTCMIHEIYSVEVTEIYSDYGCAQFNVSMNAKEPCKPKQ